MARTPSGSLHDMTERIPLLQIGSLQARAGFGHDVLECFHLFGHDAARVVQHAQARCSGHPGERAEYT